MSRDTQSTSPTSRPAEAQEEFVWPEFNPSPAYREFIERLRRARLERGLSLSDVAGEVELTFRLAHEFENITAPLPFCHLEVWCQAVGVPFEDFLAIYWADEREWQERQEEAQKAEAHAHELSRPNRGFSWLSPLRPVLDRIARFFASRFTTPAK